MERSKHDQLSRRTFHTPTAALAGGAAMLRADTPAAEPRRTTLCLFSKPLGNRPFQDLPPVLKEIGIDAVDLTCRPEGHILPERAADDLPAAVELLRKNGISVPMITTAITDADKDHAESIVKTAASLGIRYAKLGYYPYGDLARMRQTLADVKARLRDVAALFESNRVRAGFHNHSGNNVGAVIWDTWPMIEPLPATAIGSYFDLMHATVEGGKSGWRIALELLRERIIMLAVKDFVWEKTKSGGKTVNVPLGKGLAPWEQTLQILKAQRYNGPISLHMEYGGHNPPVGSDEDQANLKAIKTDLATLRAMLEKSGR
jgi:sugar phosphate isomerase/epimerase